MAMYPSRVGIVDVPLQLRIELVGLGATPVKDVAEIVEPGIVAVTRQPQAQPSVAARWQSQLVMRRDLGAEPCRVHCRRIAIDDVVIDPVLEILTRCIDSLEPPDVGVVFAKEKLRAALAAQPHRRQHGMIDRDRVAAADQ